MFVGMETRGVQQSLHQAADHAMTLEEVCNELHANMAVDQEALSRFQANAARARAGGMCVASAGDLLALTKTQFDDLNADVLSAHDVNTLCIVLGSATAPHIFPQLPAGDAAANLVHEPPVTTTLAVTSGNIPVKNSKKGGSTTEVAEMLLVRREHMTAYHVPPAFDKYHKSNPTTWAANGKELRKLVVQETLEVCGDLYPDATERAVIFGAIEQNCGAPHGNGHFDNWKDIAGKKHKGTGVSDLEKARKDPASYGVTSRCVPGRMRPQRPPRPSNAPPPSAAFVPASGGGPGTYRGTSPETTVTDSDLLDPNGVDAHLTTEQGLLDQVQQLSAQLKKLQEEKKAKDDTKKAAQKAARAAKAAAKKTPATQPSQETRKRKRVIDDDDEEEEAEDAEEEEAAVAEAAEEADDVPLQPSPFVDSALADDYEKLNYAETLFAKQQLVAVYVDPPPPPAGQQPEAKQWLLGHISAVNVRGKINGANEQAIWYRLGAPRDKRRKEFILCPTDGKQERHGIDFVFVKAAE